MIDRILRTPGRPKGCILCLPGRYTKGRDLAEVYRGLMLNRTMIVGVTPKKEWFPAARTPDDQQEAIDGLPGAVKMLDSVLRRLRRGMGINRENVVLVGVNSGATVALEAMTTTRHPFAAVVCHNGTTLDPKRLIPKIHDTKVILAHSKDDRLYKWGRRYMPMKTAMEAAGYDITAIEREAGGHGIFKDDLIRIANLLAPVLGYPSEWRHPMTDLL